MSVSQNSAQPCDVPRSETAKAAGFPMARLILSRMSDLQPAISRAVTLATRLRVISDRGRDAEFRAIVADLLLELAEVQLKFDELINENAALKGQVQAHSNPKGERCPRCFEFGWRVTSSRPHGQLGAMVQTYACGKCGLKEEVMVKGK